MNMQGTPRPSRFSEFSTPSEGWASTSEEFYNENYLPNDTNLGAIPSDSAPEHHHSPTYGPYYEYPHQHLNSSSAGVVVTGTTSPPHHHHAHHPNFPHHHHHNHHHPNHHDSTSPQIPTYPSGKRAGSSENVFDSTHNNNNNNNNNYDEKSGSTSPWNFHSLYQKNPSSPSPPPQHPPSQVISSVSIGNAQTIATGVTISSDILSPKPGRPSFKRRTTANKKERRRTQSINNAFAELRDCIPNVPADTKLSKIKTLRLATSYIAYLSEVLSGDDPLRTPQAFTAEISKKMGRGDEKRRKELLMQELAGAGMKREDRKAKGRTGWPQHVWALELQQ